LRCSACFSTLLLHRCPVVVCSFLPRETLTLPYWKPLFGLAEHLEQNKTSSFVRLPCFDINGRWGFHVCNRQTTLAADPNDPTAPLFRVYLLC
jgi:hypothetical protein